jgi:CO/xanthine dehydrogenase Mo-binding subunit
VLGLGSSLVGCQPDQAASDLATAGSSDVFSPVVWFEIDSAGAILMNIVRAEMGQHVGTALAQIIADELGADWADVSIRHVDTDPKWGYMVTGGSWSVHTSFKQLSQAGAAGRMVLAEAGARLLGVDPATCSVEGSRVASGASSVTFADIIQAGDISRSFTQEQLDAMPIKAPADRRIIGLDLPALDVPAKSDGSAQYGLDVSRPGMVYGIPLVPPTRYGSKVLGIDESAATSLPGYLGALPIEDPTDTLQGWVVVAAETMPIALKAARAVRVQWQAGETGEVSESDLWAEGLRLARDPASGTVVVDDGEVDAAIADATTQLDATYRTATALHFTLEPQNAVVEFNEAGQCHIFAGNQWQSLILPLLAQVLDLPETEIVIHQQYLGGGYGRRLFGDQMIPAALAARALGRPLKLIFDREKDSVFDCARSPTVCTFTAGLRQCGRFVRR